LKRILLSLLLSLIFTTLGVLWIIFRIDLDSDLSIMLRVPWWALSLALGCLLLSYALAAWRLKVLCNALAQQPGWLNCLRAHILGIFASVLTPGGSGGHPVVALVLARDMPAFQASTVVLAVLKYDILFFSTSLPIAISVLVVKQRLPFSNLTLVVTCLVIIGGIALSLILSYRLQWLEYLLGLLLRGRLVPLRKRGLRFVQQMTLANEGYAQRSWHWHLALQLITSLSWLSFFSILYPLARGFGLDLDWPSLTSYLLAIGLIATFVPTPGGSGFVEIALAQVLASQGQALSALVLLWRLLSHYSNFVLGPLLAGPLLGHLWDEPEAV
jgi:uncharacterized protein (TIRG00374 family)